MGDREWWGAAAAGSEPAGPVPDFRRAGGDRAGPGGGGVDAVDRRAAGACPVDDLAGAAPQRRGAGAVSGDQRARGGLGAAARPKPAKLATNLVLREKVEQYLQKKYSPEQIAGRLRVEFPDDPEMWVSTETIYQSLYVQSRGALRRELTRCLRTGRALRHPGRQPGQRKNRIPNMVNISERPAEAADRAVPGHWEGDLIIGKRNLTAIGTLVERTTGYTMLVHLPDGYKPEQVAPALAAKIQTLPEAVRRSLTWDQGPEMRDWKQVAIAADIDDLLLRPAQALAARHQREHQRPAAPVLPEGQLTCPCTPKPTWTRSPPNSTTGPANASASANRSKRSVTCSPRGPPR